MQGNIIRNIAEVANGRLSFGSMPPLGGALEPIGRLVPAGKPVQPRDVVVHGENAFAGQVEDAEACFEAAYAAGALGVISNRRMVPWDGCFGVKVVDVRSSLMRLAGWGRRRIGGPLVAVLDSRQDSPLVDWIAGGLEARALHCTDDAGDEVPLLWRLLSINSDDASVVVQLDESQQTCPSMRICEPNVIVVSDTAQEELVEHVLGLAHRNAHIFAVDMSSGCQNAIGKKSLEFYDGNKIKTKKADLKKVWDRVSKNCSVAAPKGGNDESLVSTVVYTMTKPPEPKPEETKPVAKKETPQSPAKKKAA